MLQKAKLARERAGLAPDALAQKLKEARENPGLAKRKAEENAKRMGIDINATMRKLAMRSPVEWSFVEGSDGERSEVERSPVAQSPIARSLTGPPMAQSLMRSPTVASPIARSPTARDAEIAVQEDIAIKCEEPPRILQLRTPSEKAKPQVKPAVNPAVKLKREAQIDLRDERKAKKAKVTPKPLKAQTKTKKSMLQAPTPSASASASASASLTFGESSRASAAREAATTVTATGPMDLDDSPELFVSRTDPYPVRTLPKWYTEIKDNSLGMTKIAKNKPQALTALESLKDSIGRIEAETKRGQEKRNMLTLYEELRDHVHKAEITLEVDKFIIKKSRILTRENGFPRIFKEDAATTFPSDIRADAYQLYTRWMSGNFSQDILRGIITHTERGKDRNADKLDETYKAKHPTSAKYYGSGDLVLGQWWPTQLCTLRDGAHGSSQGGIFGDKENGAYSIVLSGGGYKEDRDDGVTIEYSGTEGKDFTPTDATLCMMKSAEIGNDIRVIRSSQLLKKSKYRPIVGLRYDGLYKVESYKEVDKEKAMYVFHLERCPGQKRIRCGDNAASRPTIFEVREFDRLKSKVW
jgi:hypothetical protein